MLFLWSDVSACINRVEPSCQWQGMGKCVQCFTFFNTQAKMNDRQSVTHADTYTYWRARTGKSTCIIIVSLAYYRIELNSILRRIRVHEERLSRLTGRSILKKYLWYHTIQAPRYSRSHSSARLPGSPLITNLVSVRRVIMLFQLSGAEVSASMFSITSKSEMYRACARPHGHSHIPHLTLMKGPYQYSLISATNAQQMKYL